MQMETLEPNTPNLRRVAIVDCETTGLLDQDEPIAIAAIVVEVDAKGNATRIASWSGKQYPKADIHPKAAAVHGMTKASLTGLSFDLVALEATIAGVSCYVAHNAAFDARMIGKAVPRVVNAEWRCSYRQWAWPALANKKLDTVCAHLGVDRPNTHDAMKDAEALLLALLQKSGKTDRSMTYLGKLLAKESFGVKSQIEADRAQAQRTKPNKAKETKFGSNAVVIVVLARIALIVVALFF